MNGPAHDTTHVPGSNGFFKLLLDMLPSAAYTCTPDGQIDYFNQRARQLWGRAPRLNDPRERFCGSMNLYNLDGTQLKHEQCVMAKALAEDRSITGVEVIIERPDGKRIHALAHANPIHDADGRLVGGFNVLIDLTERRQLEERHARLINSVDAIVWEADARTFQFRFISPQAERILGYPVRRWLEEPGFWYEHIHPDDRDEAVRLCVTATNRCEDHTFEYRMIAQDGREVWLKDVVSVEVTRGVPTTLRGFMMDVTEARLAEQERRALEAQLQHTQKLESLGVLAGGIAHDFNNLLASIMGYASLATLELPRESPAYNMVREIERATERAADLTQQMLAYSGRGRFTLEEMELDALVSEMTNLLRTAISHKVHLKLDLLPASIEGDPTQVRQVVMNLITNASEALDTRDGVVSIRTGVCHATPDELRSIYIPTDLAEGDYAFIEVTDNGEGMDEETRERLFEPFFTTKFTGRGLGLAAVLGIVRGHRGTIQVTSAPGQGTTFRVLIPSVHPLARSSDASPRSPSFSGHGSILIIDDEPGITRLLMRICERAGFTAITAFDGRAGLEAFERHAGSLQAVLVDLTMPRLDGLEVLRQIRERDEELPVLLMSGFDEQEVSTRCSALGVNGFLKKPFSVGLVLENLKRLTTDSR